jgi:hypothetical protein
MVGAGSVLLVSGPDEAASALTMLVDHLDLVLLGAGALLLLLALAPGRSLVGPLIVLATGSAVLVVRRDLLTPDHGWRLAGGAVVAGGIWLAAHGRSGPAEQAVRRIVAVLVPRSMRVADGARAPHHVSVVVAGTRAAVDFTQARPAESQPIELDVSCWFGRLELTLPAAWPVAAGRVNAAYGIRFVGTLDHDEPIRDVIAAQQDLDRLCKERRARLAVDPAPRSSAVVVHVLGRGGEIVLVGRS